MSFAILWRIVMYGSYALFFVWVYYHRADPSLKLNGERFFRDLPRTFFCVLFILLCLVFLRMQEVIPRSMEGEALPPALLALYLFLFIAPAEEVLFRGVMLPWLSRRLQGYGNSAVLAVILSSIIFGLLHLPNGALGLAPALWNWQRALLTAVLGVFLGHLFLRSKSILHPILLHAVVGVWYFTL